jgi:hypothetical protein
MAPVWLHARFVGSIKVAFIFNGLFLPLDWSRFGGFRKPGGTQRRRTGATGADSVMRGQKPDKLVVFDCGRKGNSVDNAGVYGGGRVLSILIRFCPEQDGT